MLRRAAAMRARSVMCSGDPGAIPDGALATDFIGLFFILTRNYRLPCRSVFQNLARQGLRDIHLLDPCGAFASADKDGYPDAAIAHILGARSGSATLYRRIGRGPDCGGEPAFAAKPGVAMEKRPRSRHLVVVRGSRSKMARKHHRAGAAQ